MPQKQWLEVCCCQGRCCLLFFATTCIFSRKNPIDFQWQKGGDIFPTRCSKPMAISPVLCILSKKWQLPEPKPKLLPGMGESGETEGRGVKHPLSSLPAPSPLIGSIQGSCPTCLPTDMLLGSAMLKPFLTDDFLT